MKILIWYGTTTVIAAMAATMSGQSEIPNSSGSTSSYIQTSKLVGRKVRSFQGEEIGIVKDVVIDRINGCMAYTVLSTGGEGTNVSSGGGKIVAVPWAVYSPTPDRSVLTVKVARDKVYNAPVFEDTRIDEYARPDYINNIYSYYGVSPGPRTAVAAGTDVTGTAGATASPGEVASPAAIGTVSPNERPSARTHASSPEDRYSASSANPSLKGIRNARAIGTGPPTGRGETGSPATTEESASESTAAPSENKKSRRKPIEDTSTRRPSTTPQSSEGQD